jgi:hypothetical protein
MHRRHAAALFIALVLASATGAAAQRTSTNPSVIRLNAGRGTRAPAQRPRPFHPIPLHVDTIPLATIAQIFEQKTLASAPFVLSAAHMIEPGRGFLSFANADFVDPRDGGDAFMQESSDVLVYVEAEGGKTYVLEVAAQHACVVTGDPCPANADVTLDVSVPGGARQPLVIPQSTSVGIAGFYAPVSGHYGVNLINKEKYRFLRVRVRALQ